MSTFTVKIDTDGAAFHREDDDTPDPGAELARILRVIADRVEREHPVEYDMFQTILDINGNDVGRFALKPADYR